MTIEQFLKESTAGLDLSEEVAQQVREDLRETLTAQMQTGMTEEEAIQSLVDPEQEVARLILKYDDSVQAKQTGEGKMPMMFWWGLMLSLLLVVLKALQWVLMEHAVFHLVGIGVGIVGLVACGIYALIWKKKHSAL